MKKKTKKNDIFQKKIIHIYILIFIAVIILVTSGILMLKYHIEGETNLPFNLNKISTLCTAQSKLYQEDDETWKSDIMQKNNIFFTIQKNENYKKEDSISKVIFTNFKIDKEKELGLVNIYRPSKENNEYTYSDEYIVLDNLEYVGSKKTNTELLQINNQGGVIGFSIATKDLGTYTMGENEKLASDGTLLKKAGLELEDIKLNIEFDLIIETEKGNKFKTHIDMELPTENILETGISKSEKTQLKDIVFKRF